MPRQKPHESFFPTYAFNLETIVQDIEKTLARHKDVLDKILSENTTFTWDNLMQVLEKQDYALDCVLSQLSHIQAVKSSEKIQEVKKAIDEMITQFGVERTQDQRLFKAVSAIDKETLNPEQQKIVDDTLLAAKLVGIDKPAEVQQRIKEIKTELSNLSNQFQKNNTDSEKDWVYVIKNKKRLGGLPDDTIAEAKKIAKEKKLDGWAFTLSLSTMITVLNSAEDRELRKSIYYGYMNTSSELNNADIEKGRDNGPVICRQLALRQELAHLLGYEDYRGVSLAKKMATIPQVDDFLSNLTDAVDVKAKEEALQLQIFAKTLGIDEFKPWDNRFVQQKLTKATFDLDENELKPYFPLSKVLQGLWSIVGTNFDMKVEEVKDVKTIDEAVRVFDFYNNKTGDYVGRIYADFYARPGEKRGGAWMDCTYPRFARTKDETLPPVIVANCNFTAPSGTEECLLTPSQARTLLHEFGHALHGVLTTAHYPSTSGTQVPWDAVEMPSQFNENFLEQPETLALLSGNKNGDPIPEEKLAKVFEEQKFMQATSMKRQLVFATFDWTLHAITETDKLQPSDVHRLFDNVAQTVSYAPWVANTRFANSFGHLFSGAYGAGYWLYNWSLMMACDAWEVFSKDGPLNPAEGQRYLQELLGPGGSRPFEDLWMNYVGHKPRIEPLLCHLGVAKEEPKDTQTLEASQTLTPSFNQQTGTQSLASLVAESEHSQESKDQPEPSDDKKQKFG